MSFMISETKFPVPRPDVSSTMSMLQVYSSEKSKKFASSSVARRRRSRNIGDDSTVHMYTYKPSTSYSIPGNNMYL